MAGQPHTNKESVDSMMNEILASLDIIKKQLPNGELKAIQERIERIVESQEDMQEDLRQIKKQLLDPENGVIVRVNKNTEFRQRKEIEEKEYAKFLDEHKELVSFKATVTRILWVIFTAIASIIVAMIFGGQVSK